MTAGGKCPVTVIGGFLGSGKTTLLRQALADGRLRDTAVVINEWGDVAIDHHLVWQVGEQRVVLGGGCVCCTRREDLVRALRGLLDMHQRAQIPPLRGVVIETSGLADPAPVLFTLVTDPVLQHHFTVDGVVVTVDAVHGQGHLDRHPESRKQVAVADRIIVTKVDMAEPSEVKKVVERLRLLNPVAAIARAVFGHVEGEDVVTPGAGGGALALSRRTGDGFREGGDVHGSETRALSLRFDAPLDWVAFGVWLSMLLHARGEDVLRVKGLLDVKGVGPVVVNGVQHVIHPPEHLGQWPTGDAGSRLVIITRNVAAGLVARSLKAFQGIAGALG